ncbi:hypothetical protein EJD96_19795 [Herbaspirillum seropedicae]|uniref:hypothetical protein n=1 Tax=Herbaspirillum seropedicae TaxID=964 RepID=UPI001123D29F|nr:hypothetical protein [Herbaspirillum seropedicae]QDD66240.1 hypothetical protein EJD96_19795 [Herbaspirillum seropedicae]
MVQPSEKRILKELSFGELPISPPVSAGSRLIAMDLALERLAPALLVYTMSPLALAAYCFFAACSLSGARNKSWDEERNEGSVLLIYRLQIFASLMSILAVIAVTITIFWRIFS